MAIWFNKNIKLENLIPLGTVSMSELLGIEWVELGDDFLKAKMPVDKRTKQQMGLLHGGASCVLAETIGSVASYNVIDSSTYFCVGIEINANHIRTVRSGYVTGTATPLHLGKSTHVWDIKIHDENGKLVCVSRHTVAVIKQKDH
jgi:1,4-dihydroxy-2-naphthoyl-CoA hydrolase